MTNVHHLHVVGQGAGRWNAWRQQEPDVLPDLAGADLKGADLAGMDLTGAVLSLANLRKADLSGANLRLANLAGANMDEVNLSGAYLEGATIAGAYLLRANLSGACLRRVNLAGASLVGKINLSGADLTGANLAGARLVGAKLTGANLTRAILAGTDLREADLGGATLTDADTSGAKFDGANMSGAIIRDYRVGGRQRPYSHDDADGGDDETGELDFEAGQPGKGKEEKSLKPEGEAQAPTPSRVEASEDLTPDMALAETTTAASEPESASLMETLEAPATEAPQIAPAPLEARQPSPPKTAPESVEEIARQAPVAEPPSAPVEEAGQPALPKEPEPVETVAPQAAESAPAPAEIVALAEPEAPPVLAEAPLEMAQASAAIPAETSPAPEPATAQQAPVVHPQLAPAPAPAPEEEADEGFYTYERKDLAILMLYSEPFSRKTKEERRLLVDLLMQYNKIFFGVKTQISMATKDSSIIAGFENPTDALRCAGLYINILRDMKVDSSVCVNWGFATIRTDMDETGHSDLLLNSISPAARLRPIATSGEVLILEELFSNAATDKDLFVFEPVTRKWTLSSDQSGPSVDVLCYRVRNREASGTA
ncbi:MAG: pentapeptide repeat-containing protein [Alphaproteobacteria bacterium]|nr:pentapeptide repeat-containing protein [Alphaproteobacteria bacterium]